MPDFVAALVTAAIFCAGLIALNGLTRLAIAWHVAPSDLGENGLLQYGLAVALAGVAWRRALRRQSPQNKAGIVNE
ncbi:hypothetical protein G3T14_08730 [Methylobacterium sp. BTF04]|uniref:hypothetical protein n=1 Tax=Methylobacterium sp. BTF04 TaxID=2708300 RepID=UPI0013D10178|nr:hypothetical protein [Methylobacterium sp. BTF04]NEU12216.1 hypothetical protein [Methylobacterium sp. BTF04]